jgi:murein L,D-transpeptidase YafK
MTAETLGQYKTNKNYTFWKNLKQGYDAFSTNKKRIDYTINDKGEYVIK